MEFTRFELPGNLEMFHKVVDGVAEPHSLVMDATLIYKTIIHNLARADHRVGFTYPWNHRNQEDLRRCTGLPWVGADLYGPVAAQMRRGTIYMGQGREGPPSAYYVPCAEMEELHRQFNDGVPKSPPNDGDDTISSSR